MQVEEYIKALKQKLEDTQIGRSNKIMEVRKKIESQLRLVEEFHEKKILHDFRKCNFCNMREEKETICPVCFDIGEVYLLYI